MCPSTARGEKKGRISRRKGWCSGGSAVIGGFSLPYFLASATSTSRSSGEGGTTTAEREESAGTILTSACRSS